jgi:poly(3-hydroxybutyrate) depolymerase
MISTRVSTLIIVFIPYFSFGQGELQLKTASDHPMMYYISLPQNWSPSKSWPVIFILEAAEKEFKKNAERFVEARRSLPFILVAPINTNNGNQGRKDPTVFPYSKETWNYIDRVGDCAFNAAGINQIIHDVQKEFNGEGKIYLTGFEAGAHDLWSIVFNHPEYLNAAAPVGGNYRGRCVDVNAISKDPSRSNLPITALLGKNDEVFGPSGQLYNQWTDPKKLAQANGYNAVTEIVLADKGHEPLPQEVLAYFNKLLQN